MFKAKVVVITGAAGGIGRCLINKLLSEGARVFAWDLDLKPLRELEKEAKINGKILELRQVDVTNREALEAAMKSVVGKYNKIDYWFNNAGISGMGDFQKNGEQAFDKVFDVNFRGTLLGLRLALTHMETIGSGTIINMGSVAGHVAPPFLSAYSASKHAVVGLTRSLQIELEMVQSPINLVLVSPGFVDTAMVDRGGHYGFPEWLSFLLSSPEKVAGAIIRGLEKNKKEISPTLNGKVMMEMHRFFPRPTVKGSKVLLAKKFSDVIFNRYQSF